MSTAKDVIDKIRREEFLIGVELPPDAHTGVRNVRATLHRALRLLSEELYSRDAHFVLELIQNADDNHYDAGDTPTIRFDLAADRVVITNNETGFAPANVRALCSIGNSTKAKRDGFIGEKGIGFKSVFAVSDRPEVHSNDFHFGFDIAVDDLLGYVVPIWIDGHTQQNGTKIVLPIKHGRAFTSSTLSELSAELLLFLRKLRRLEVQDATAQSVVLAIRTDEGQRITLSSTKRALSGCAQTHSSARYLRVEHPVSMADLIEAKRPDIAETSLILAFPLNEDGTASCEATHSVFAFLPIRNVGLNFVVQADFLLNSSREDIHKDLPWNVRLRDAIAATFVDAIPHLTGDETLERTWFEYVPDVFDIADDFFQEAAGQIVQRLSETRCVRGRSGAWCLPSQILFADAEFQALFPNEDLQRALQREYPAANFTMSARQVLVRLGSQSSALSHIIALLRDEELLAQKPASWFANLYDYLARSYTAEHSRRKLRALPFIRVNGGTLKSVEAAEIFLPLTRSKRYGFEKDLDILDPNALSGPADRSSRVREFLTELGLYEASPVALIENHILPQHAGDDWKSAGREVLAGHVAYIKDHLSDYIQSANDAVERLRSGLYIQTKKRAGDTAYFNRPRALYLPAEYSPEVPLEELLGAAAPADEFVAPAYLEYGSEDAAPGPSNAASEWREFFYRIGVNRVPVITRTTSGSRVDFDAGLQLKRLLESTDRAILGAAIRIIDRNWSNHYGQFKTCQHASGVPLAVASEFATRLRRVSAPTTRGLVPLSETFLNTEALHIVFGKSASYLAVDIIDDDFKDTVGITHRIDASACVRRLDQLRAAERVAAKELHTLYSTLEVRFATEAPLISQALAGLPRVYVPAQKRWFRTMEVVWESGGALLDSLYPPLERVYPELRTFFCRHLSVARRPSDEALVSSLKALPSFEATTEQRQREAYYIYRRLNAALREVRQADPESVPSWLARLRKEDLFLDHVGRLVNADNDLYIDDQPKLAELFRQHVQISFIPIERAHIATVRMLLEACRIPMLSESVRYDEISASGETMDPQLSKRIRVRAPAIMRLFFHRHHALFESAVANGMWGVLSRLEIRWVDELSVRARLAEYSEPFRAEILRDREVVYVRRDARAARDKLCTELCAMLGSRSDLADAVHRVLFAESDEELDQLFEARGIEPIPAEELARLKTVALERSEEATNAAELDESFNEEDSTFDDIVRSSEPAQGMPPSGADRGVAAPNRGSRSAGPSDRVRSPSTELSSAADSMRHSTGRAGTASPSAEEALQEGVDGAAAVRLDRPPASGRLLSYAEPQVNPGESSPGASEEAEARRAIAHAAVSFVLGKLCTGRSECSR